MIPECPHVQPFLRCEVVRHEHRLEVHQKLARVVVVLLDVE